METLLQIQTTLTKINVTQGEEESLKGQSTHKGSFFLITNLIITYLVSVSYPAGQMSAYLKTPSVL